MRRRFIILRCLSALVAICWLAVAQAEQAVQAMVFFEEPVTLTAVPGKQRHLLVVLPQPALSSPVYALKGLVRYDSVEGHGFLQMNSDFGEKGTFFTKGLAHSGPLASLSGNSDWRPFVLPFYANRGELGGDEPPVEVTLALHLPGAGSVELRDIRLFQYEPDEDPLAGPWSGRSQSLRQLVLIVLLGLLFVSALVALIRRSTRG